MQDMLTKAPAWVSPPMSERALALFAVDAGVTVAAVGAQAVPAAVALSAVIAAADESAKDEGTWGTTTVTCYPSTTTNLTFEDAECLLDTPIPETPLAGVLRCEFDVSCECCAGGFVGELTFERPVMNGVPCFDLKFPKNGRCPVKKKMGQECARHNEYRITQQHPGVQCNPRDPQGLQDAVQELCDPQRHSDAAVSACRTFCLGNEQPTEKEVQCLTYPPGKGPRRMKAA